VLIKVIKTHFPRW